MSLGLDGPSWEMGTQPRQQRGSYLSQLIQIQDPQDSLQRLCPGWAHAAVRVQS